MQAPTKLPPELRALVRQTVASLGEVIRRELGSVAYKRIECIRRDMASLREARPQAAHDTLMKTLTSLKKLSAQDRFYIAHSFGLMLEVMNACENAYRTYRLRERPKTKISHGPKAIVYVLTAHPTEARSPETIAVFHQLQGVLIEALETRFDEQASKIRHLLEIAWRLMAARRSKPSVEDEAEHVYSIVLRDETLIQLLESGTDIAPVYIRTWVGGDKDGHPGVDEKVMIASMSLSRRRIVAFAKSQFVQIKTTLNLLPQNKTNSELITQLRALERVLADLKTLDSSDGTRVMRFHALVRKFKHQYEHSIGATHPTLTRMDQLIKLFPGLVVPLELREASDLIMQGADGKPVTITRMLKTLARVSRGANPRWYARGFVISMASSLEHMKAALTLMQQAFGAPRIPIVPLFEQRAALENATTVVESVLKDSALKTALRKHWGGQFEVMVGYSDSAKEAGVLPSRLAIAQCLKDLDVLFQRHGVTPVFFHGSGGSVDRGGGSIQEQTAWWPKSALNLYKATIQGEMIERTFASPDILRGGLEKIAERAASAKKIRVSPKVVHSFADAVGECYRKKVNDTEFLKILQCATAYRYLSVLRIGSRPSKRNTEVSLGSLRAIPWVLSWTQTRVLFPTWWGVGSTWKNFSRNDKTALKKAFQSDPLFRTFVKLLGFTLAKVELPIWRLYLESSGLSPQLVEQAFEEFNREYQQSVAFLRAMSNSNDLLWFRPWLGQSIKLRSSMIHPLNLLQIIAFREQNAVLIRETVTGIASGMMTTG